MAEKSSKEIKALMESQGMKPDRHNWMYAFMTGPVKNVDLGFQKQDGIFLVAYCKQCDQTVTVLAPTGEYGDLRLSRVGIPKLGCDWNGE